MQGLLLQWDGWGNRWELIEGGRDPVETCGIAVAAWPRSAWTDCQHVKDCGSMRVSELLPISMNFYDRILYSISSLWIVNVDQTGYLIRWAFGKLWAASPIAYGGFLWPARSGLWSSWGLSCIPSTPMQLFRIASSDCCRTYSTQQAQTLLQLWFPPPLPPPFWSLHPIAPTTPLSISWSNQPTKFAIDLAHPHLPNILQF